MGCHEYDAEVAQVAHLLQGLGKILKPNLHQTRETDALLDLLAMLALAPRIAKDFEVGKGKGKGKDGKAKEQNKAEEESRLKAEEDTKLLVEAEAKVKAADEVRLKAVEDARIKAEEEARLKAEEEEATLKAGEVAKSKAVEDAPGCCATDVVAVDVDCDDMITVSKAVLLRCTHDAQQDAVNGANSRWEAVLDIARATHAKELEMLQMEIKMLHTHLGKDPG